MSERERLIEILNEAQLKCDDNYGMTNTTQMADYLLENGVIVLPVKVGTKVYLPTINETKILERTIDGYRTITDGYAPVEMLVDGCWGRIDHIGKTVFSTREEAEKALKEREENA